MDEYLKKKSQILRKKMSKVFVKDKTIFCCQAQDIYFFHQNTNIIEHSLSLTIYELQVRNPLHNVLQVWENVKKNLVLGDLVSCRKLKTKEFNFFFFYI